MQLARDVPSQESHPGKRQARMPRRETLERVVHQVFIRLRADRIV